MIVSTGTLDDPPDQTDDSDDDDPYANRYSSLWSLQERCDASSASAFGRETRLAAQIDACVAAADVCGGNYARVDVDWQQAIQDLIGVQRMLRSVRRQRIVPGGPIGPTIDQVTEAWADADAELMERIHHAIRAWEERVAEDEPQPPETNMTTATPSKRKAKKTLEVQAWQDPTGVAQWLCPQCRSLHALILKTCGCGFSRPAIESLTIETGQFPPWADSPVTMPRGTAPSYTDWLRELQEQTGLGDNEVRNQNEQLLGLFNEGRSVADAVAILQAIPETQEQAATKEAAASGIETNRLAFSPAAKLEARIDLKEQDGIWLDRISTKNGWLKRGHGRLNGAIGMTEQLDEHVVGKQRSRADALRCAVGRLREQLAAIAEEYLTPAGIKARGVALRDMDGEQTRLLGDGPISAPEEQTLPPGSAGAGPVKFEARLVLVKTITFRRDNPRGPLDPENVDRIASSIAEQGLQAPVGLRHNGDGSYEGWYGAHRFAAVRTLGHDAILANVYPVGTPDEVMRSLRADDNLAHGDLHPIARAQHYREKLIAAGWKPDSEDGPSLRSLASTIGVSQGELSNQLGLLRLPAEWQQRLISRDITPTQARMLAPWIDRAEVLQEVARRIQDRAEWTTAEFLQEVHLAVEHVTRPAHPKAYLGWGEDATGRWTSRHVLLTAKELEQHRAALDLVEYHSGRDTRVVAFNVSLFDRLQAEAEKAAAKRTAKKRDAGDGGKQAELTPAERKAREKQQAAQLEKRVARYKNRWLQQAASKRAETVEGHLCTRLLLYFAAIDDNGRCREVGETVKSLGGQRRGGREHWQLDAWGSLGTLSASQCVAAARKFLAMRLTADTESSRCGLRINDIPAIAAELGVEFEAEWRCDEEFLRLFTKDQLAGLIREWKITLLPAKTRDDLIQSILTHQTNRGGPLSVPKILAKAK